MEEKEMLDAIEAELKRIKFKYTRKTLRTGKEVIDTDCCSRSGLTKFYDVRFLARNHGVQVVYRLPYEVPEKLRGEMAKYLSVVNYDILRGKFTMSENGDLYFELVIEDVVLERDGDAVMEFAFGMCLGTVDEYLKGFSLVVIGARDALSAFFAAKEAEEDEPSPLPLEDEPSGESADLLSSEG